MEEGGSPEQVSISLGEKARSTCQVQGGTAAKREVGEDCLWQGAGPPMQGGWLQVSWGQG